MSSRCACVFLSRSTRFHHTPAPVKNITAGARLLREPRRGLSTHWISKSPVLFLLAFYSELRDRLGANDDFVRSFPRTLHRGRVLRARGVNSQSRGRNDGVDHGTRRASPFGMLGTRLVSQPGSRDDILNVRAIQKTAPAIPRRPRSAGGRSGS